MCLKKTVKRRHDSDNNDVFIYCRGSKYDEKMAFKLYKALKKYRLPEYVAADKRRVQGVFFDAGKHAEQAMEVLKHSAYLILLCSLQSLSFKETTIEIIDTFKATGGTHIILMVTNGNPKVYTDAFTGDLNEPLAADITAGNMIKALSLLRVEKLRILAPMLGLGFDDLKQRHRERFMKKVVGIITAVITAVIILGTAGTYLWIETDRARKNAIKAIDLAEKQTEIARRQFDLSSKVFHNIYINVGNDFEKVPEMKQTVQHALDEISGDLKRIKGFERLLEELVENPNGSQ